MAVLRGRWWTASIPGRAQARSKPLRVFARASDADVARSVYC